MSVIIEGQLRKMASHLSQPIEYALVTHEREQPINDFIGQAIQIEFLGEIICQACGRLTKKSFQQGFCFPCMRSLARCDSCIVKPELCHFHLGTCREPDWGRAHCMQAHIIYLANTSALKVGITRATQIPTRWIDQGATQAIAMYSVNARYHSGLVEAVFKQIFNDKTNWRNMLKCEPSEIDMLQAREQAKQAVAAEIEALQALHGDLVLTTQDSPAVTLSYPIMRYPDKVVSLNLDKQPIYSGILTGVKGQYLIMHNTVINCRKYTGYRCRIILGE